MFEPWWLAGLAALPVLWWLLRVTPPAPQRTRFPAIQLLLALAPREETPARTPLWLLALRLLLATLIFFALAHPVLNPGARLAGSGPLVVVIDDGWTASRNWTRRKETLARLIDRADQDGRGVMIVTTAPGPGGEPPRPSRLMTPADARAIAPTLEPKPWPVDRKAAGEGLNGVGQNISDANIVYLSDGVGDAELLPFVNRLQHLGMLQVLTDPPNDLARLLMTPAADATGLSVSSLRTGKGEADHAWLRASAEDGRLLAREELRWAPDQAATTAQITLPSELRNRISRLEIEGETSAGGVVLLDERWRRRPVGLVSGGPVETMQPLLADLFYLTRALSPYAEVRVASVEDLLQREIAMLVLADVGRLPEPQRATLEAWVRKGGVLVRFAGPRLAEGSDGLVPVSLRSGGGRAFGGAMSWSQPLALAPFDPASPFAGLEIPEDVKVLRQVLAEPSLDLSHKTWARLVDGTPLVTAEKRDSGWVVLVHTTANPEWSSLALSGLYVEMLRRLVSLSQGVGGSPAGGTLPPLISIDGFGRMVPPPPAAVALEAKDLAEPRISPRHPPGLYGSEGDRRAFNLSTGVPVPYPIEALPSEVARGRYAEGREIDLQAWLFFAALVLLLVDLIASLALRGLWQAGRRGARGTAVVLVAAGLISALLAGSALAQAGRPAAAAADGEHDAEAVLATLGTRFGYVVTGNQNVDEVSRLGLAGLAQVLQRRTAVDAGPPVALDLDRDELSFYPLIYWPVLAETARPSAAVMGRIDSYLRLGGNILFDTREGELGGATTGPAAQRLREILRGLNLPPLIPVPHDHVLTKAFYLLQEFPGRWAGAPVWVEQPDERVNDGVSSVILGAHDWAAAWAVDAQGRPMFAVVPGGEEQREFAIRFGVNLVMYTLAGNYKADQVHVDSILERLRR